MKKNLIYAGMLLLGMTVATGCSNEESLEQILNDGNVIEAVIESATEARTSVSDNYEVLWSTGDQFDVWNETSKVGTLELKSGVGTTSGSFGLPANATAFDVENSMTAFYPATINDTKTYTYATEYTDRTTNAPMLGTFANGKFTFSLLTAMVRVVVTNVPVGTAKLTITAGTDIKLTGEATLSNDALSTPNGTNEVTVTVDNETAGATLTFDVPVPAQEYTGGLNVKLTVGNDEVFDKKTNEFTAEVGKIYVFGATYVSVDGSDVEATLQEALESGEAVVLTGNATEVEVSSLTLPTETTATLDLNGKTLKLGESASTMALGRSTSGHGIVNSGTLTITNGTITWTDPNDRSLYAIKNEIGATMNIDDCKISAPVWNLGAMSVTNESEITTDIDVRSALVCGADDKDYAWTFTMEGGSIVSEKHTATVLMNNYYQLDPKGLAKLDGVTLKTGNSEGSAYDVYLAAVNVEMNGCTLTNDKVYLQAKDYVSYVGGVKTIKEDKCCKWSEIFGAPITTAEALTTALGNVPTDGTPTAIVLGESIQLETQLNINTGNCITLDLNGKTLTLKSSDSHGLTNNGTLTVKNGDIAWTNPNDRSLYAIKNAIGATMNIDDCKISAPVWNLGAMSVTNESEITTDIDVRSALVCGADEKDYAWTFTMEGGSIVSEKHTATVLMNNYYGLSPMGLAKLDGVTLKTGNSEGSAYDVYLAAVNVEMNGCTLTNDKVYLQAKDYVSYVGGVETIREDKCCKWSEIFPATNE